MEKAIIKLRKEMKEQLSASRYEHTVGVMYTAGAMAMRYGADIDRAMTAGVLHDNAKAIPHPKKIRLCEKYKIPMNEAELQNPGLLHAKLGAALAAADYRIDDTGILNAIRFHTTGRPEMTLLEKILYISDFIEPGREEIPRLDEIRRMAFIDINRTLLMILENTLSYLKENGEIIDPLTQETYDYYKKQSGNSSL